MKPAAHPESEGPTTLFHRQHARRQRGKALLHMAPALILLTSALGVITGQARLTWLTGIEFVVGAAYLILLVRELLHLRAHPHHQEPVAWLEIAAAGILAVEGYHIWHRHHEADALRGIHKFHLLPYVYWTVALLFLAMAFGFQKLVARRHLHLHDKGFSVRTGPFRRAHELPWADIAAAEAAGKADLVVRRTNGQQHRFSFSSLHDGPAHRDRLLARIRKQLTTGEKQ